MPSLGHWGPSSSLLSFSLSPDWENNCDQSSVLTKIEILTACCVSISTFLLSSSAIWLNHNFSLIGMIFIFQIVCESILTVVLSMTIMMINICNQIEPQLEELQLQVHCQSIIQPPQSSPLRHSLPPWGALATELLKMDKLLGMLTLVLVSASLIKGTVPKEAYTFYISKKYDSQPGQRRRRQSSCP